MTLYNLLHCIILVRCQLLVSEMNIQLKNHLLFIRMTSGKGGGGGCRLLSL